MLDYLKQSDRISANNVNRPVKQLYNKYNYDQQKLNSLIKYFTPKNETVKKVYYVDGVGNPNNVTITSVPSGTEVIKHYAFIPNIYCLCTFNGITYSKDNAPDFEGAETALAKYINLDRNEYYNDLSITFNDDTQKYTLTVVYTTYDSVNKRFETAQYENSFVNELDMINAMAFFKYKSAKPEALGLNDYVVFDNLVVDESSIYVALEDDKLKFSKDSSENSIKIYTYTTVEEDGESINKFIPTETFIPFVFGDIEGAHSADIQKIIDMFDIGE